VFRTSGCIQAAHCHGRDRYVRITLWRALPGLQTGDVLAQPGLARTRPVPGHRPSLCGSAWSCPPQGIRRSPSQGRYRHRRPARGSQPVPARIRSGLPLLCACERPGPLGRSIRRKAGGTGGRCGCEPVCAHDHQAGADLPPVPRGHACALAGQARIVDVPFETCLAALDSRQRTGRGGELRSGGSQLAGPMEYDRDTGTRRIEVRLARGLLRPLVRMRLDIDRWSSSSTALELTPCGRVRPTAAYFRAGHLLLDSLTRSVLQHLPPAQARDTASQPPVPAGSRHP
jgi:hypothetical protein